MDRAGEDRRKALLAALETLELAPDTAELLLTQILADAPDIRPIDLIARIAANLQEQAPRRRSSRRTPAKAKDTSKAALEPDDLRAIAAAAKAGNRPAHAAFVEAGVVKPPIADFAA